MEERRRVARTPVCLEIKEINRQPGAGTFLRDYSTLGARMETPLTLLPGDAVEFSYVQPGEEREIRHWGQVVWVLPAPDKPGHFLVGIEFLMP